VYSRSESEVYGPAATAMVQDCLGSPLFRLKSSEATVKVTEIVGSKHIVVNGLLTDKTSDTWNQSPVAFRPLNAAIAPGKSRQNSYPVVPLVS
jgi:hypothetical protein